MSNERPPVPPTYRPAEPEPGPRTVAPRVPRPVPPRLEQLAARHPLVIAAVIVAVTVTWTTAVLTGVAFGASSWWIFDILTSYRPQYTLVLAIAVVTLAVLRCWRSLAVAVVALALNVVVVAPVFTQHQAAPRSGSPTLTIAHLNLQSRTGDLAAMDRWLDSGPADVVVLLHTTDRTANHLAGGVGPYRMIYPVFAGLNNNLKRVYEPSAEVIVVTDRPDVTASVPTLGGLPIDAVNIEARIGSTRVSLLGCHTLSPGTGARYDTRNEELDAIGRWLRSTRRPAIAFGDFNVTYYSPSFQHLLHLGHATSSQLGFGIQATWPHQFRPAGIAIDQSVYTGPITAVARYRGPSLGSEHRALIVRYALTG